MEKGDQEVYLAVKAWLSMSLLICAQLSYSQYCGIARNGSVMVIPYCGNLSLHMYVCTCQSVCHQYSQLINWTLFHCKYHNFFFFSWHIQSPDICLENCGKAMCKLGLCIRLRLFFGVQFCYDSSPEKQISYWCVSYTWVCTERADFKKGGRGERHLIYKLDYILNWSQLSVNFQLAF